MEFISPHQEMMYNLMVAAFEGSDADVFFNKGLDLLKSGNVNPFELDNQLFRELKVKRWSAERRLALYDAISNYIVSKNIGF